MVLEITGCQLLNDSDCFLGQGNACFPAFVEGLNAAFDF
jgi:hypothetical protein